MMSDDLYKQITDKYLDVRSHPDFEDGENGAFITYPAIKGETQMANKGEYFANNPEIVKKSLMT